MNQDLCRNGQSESECTEIDPCESCYQGEKDWADMIERSRGLADKGGTQL